VEPRPHIRRELYVVQVRDEGEVEVEDKVEVEVKVEVKAKVEVKVKVGGSGGGRC
jgi:hypothetical protein